MKIKTAIKILFVTFFFFSTISLITAQSGVPFEIGSYLVVVNGQVDRDLYTQLSLSPSLVEIKQPSSVLITALNPNGTPKANRSIKIYIDGDSTGVTLSQPATTNSHGETVGTVSSTVSGSYLVCAKDVTDGFDILISDCETLYVTPVPIPVLATEPLYTKGNSNLVVWDTSGSLTYLYLAQSSKKSNFNPIVSQSTWISTKGYNFQNLSNGQIYFYRVKAKNIYGGESSWSNYVFSVQDASGPEITIIDISTIGENNTQEWDEEYVLNIKYRIKDNVEIASKVFWCVGSDGGKRECPYTHSTNGDIWEINIKLGDLELDENGNLRTEYSFCVEAADFVGNVTRNCNAKVIVPKSGGDIPTSPIKPPSVIIKEVEKVIKEVIDNTIGKLEPVLIQDSSVTTTAANITIGFSILLGGLGSLPYFLLQLILALLSLLGFRKKGNISGYVYDSVTKEPISQAIVRVYNENNELIWTDVTNGNGYFTSVEVENAEYYIKVSARNYTFPSKIIFGKTDFPLENVYHGEDFLSRDKKIPDFSIPMDRIEIKAIEKNIQKFFSRTKLLWKSLHVLLFLTGLIVSIYALSVTHIWWNYLIVILYIPSLFALLLSFFSKKQKYGKVKDEKKNLLADVIVGLKEDEFDKLVSKRVTDHKGEYRFIVDEGTYSIVILNSELRTISEKGINKIKVAGKGMNIICPNITVKKLEDTATEDVEEPLGEL
ncbi:MAG: carboxypeptidase regulatory-like domain-containing protein [Candidatus Dojkabacteria bacterium]